MSALSFKRWSLVIIFVSALFGSVSASHFKLTSGSYGGFMEVIVDSLIHPTINGLPLKHDDEIAVFDSNGNCWGFVVWDSIYSLESSPQAFYNIVVWGVGPGGFGGGMAAGATLHFRVWDTTAGEMPASVSYYPVGASAPGGMPPITTSTYAYQGWSVLSSLSGLGPGAPTLYSPANGAMYQPISGLTLSWASNSTGGPVTSYTVQLSTSSTFSTTINNWTNPLPATTTSEALPTLVSGTTYYWEASATGPYGGPVWTSAWSFTTALPGAPTLLSPTNNAQNQPISGLTLSWASNSAGGPVTSYTVQLSTSSTFSTTINNWTNPLPATTTSEALPTLVIGTNYYWEVAATVSGGTAWASAWSFSTVPPPAPAPPSLSLPSSGSANQPINLTLSWVSGSGSVSASYSVQVATSSTFATTVFSQTGMTSTSVAPSGLAYGGVTYYWEATATNLGGTSAWSSIWSFVTLAAPSAPALSSPSNGVTGQASALTLSWTSANGAASYTVHVSTGSTFTNTAFSQTGTGLSGAVSGLTYAGITYYWQAGGINSAGTTWSGVWSFTTGIVAAPTLESPSNGATDQSVTSVALSWSTVAEATSYEVEVAASTAFSPTIFDQTGAGLTGAIVTSGLSGGSTTYYWRANASSGGVGAWSNAWSFVTQAVPAAPALVSPTSPATITIGQPITLTWATTGTATSYTIQVATISSFSSTIFSQSGLTTSCQFTPTQDTLNYWRVSATNSAGAGAWSSVWILTPYAVTVLPSEDAGLLKTEFAISNAAISYTLATSGSVEISIGDLLGRTALVLNRTQTAGRYAIELKNCNLAAGKYVVRFKAAGIDRSLQIILTR
jgi:hypothetical protein